MVSLSEGFLYALTKDSVMESSAFNNNKKRFKNITFAMKTSMPTRHQLLSTFRSTAKFIFLINMSVHWHQNICAILE